MADELPVIITIELDTKNLDGEFLKLEKKSSESATRTGSDYEKALGKAFSKSLVQRITETTAAIGKVGLAVAGTTAVSASLFFQGKNILQAFTDISKVLLQGKGLFGATSALSGVAAASAVLAKSLENTESAFLKVIQVQAILIAALTGSLAAALGFAIIQVAELANLIGTKLVKKFQDASSAFVQSDSGLQVFSKTVENFDKVTNGAVGTTSSWLEEIDNLSKAFNISSVSLTKASQEIIQVGSQLGLQEDQLKSLIKVTAEYAKVNKKDVFDTSVAIVSALNGQSQSVQALGIKLNEASVQQFAYKKGINESIRSLASNEVVQLRFNKLLDQYSNIAGIAGVAAESLADQQKKLEINQKRLSAALGRGAALIEQNNLGAAAYNLVLNNLSDTTIAVGGFIGALGARFLQIGGLVLGFSFKIFGLIKAIKILNIVLSNQSSISLFEATIPTINKSLNDLISGIAKTEIKVNSLKSLIGGLGGSVKVLANSFSIFITGSGLKGLTLFGALQGAISRLTPILLTGSKALFAFLLPLAPLIIKIGLIVAAGKLLFEAFKLIEERTGALSAAWEILSDLLFAGAGIFKPLVDLVIRLKDSLIELASKGFGLVVAGISNVLQGILAIANTGFGKSFLSDEQIARLQIASIKLDTLSGDLQNVAFDFRKLGSDAEQAGRSIAGSLKQVRPEDLASLQNELKDVGKSQLQIITETRDARLELLTGSLEQGLLTELRFQELRTKVLQDFSIQRNEILAKENAEALRLQEQLSNSVIALQTSLSEFNLTELEKIDLQQQERLALITNALDQEIISFQQAENIKSQIVDQANQQRNDITGKSLKQLNNDISKQIQGSTVKIFSSAFQEIGRTLAGAGQGFKGFLGVVLSILGDLAIAIGTTVIGSAKAIAALKASLLDPLGAGQAIVLGGALIAIGAALKVFSGSFGGSSAGFSTAGASSGGGGSSFDEATFTTPEIERENPAPVFQLTVNGDMFDTADTAKRVIDIFTQAANDEGVEFKNGAFA